jgi:hypothetical protein
MEYKNCERSSDVMELIGYFNHVPGIAYVLTTSFQKYLAIKVNLKRTRFG